MFYKCVNEGMNEFYEEGSEIGGPVMRLMLYSLSR